MDNSLLSYYRYIYSKFQLTSEEDTEEIEKLYDEVQQYRDIIVNEKGYPLEVVTNIEKQVKFNLRYEKEKNND